MTPEQLKDSLRYARDLRSTIARARDYTKALPPIDLFLDAETIIGSMAFLIMPKLEYEHRYREMKVMHIEEGKSVAEAEARAKATEEYKNFKELEATYLLAEDQCQMLKKFKEDLQAEYKRT